ncbi:MAG: DUF935 family protein, partial [Aestuariibacter sp.]|nr:DUF935 family protein [Aestuariibacter sp.]
VRAKFRLSEPGPKDEVFTAPAAAALPDMNRAVNRQEPEKKDTADLYADQVSDAMQTVTDGLPGPVKKLVMTAGSLEEIHNSLFDLYPDMDSSEYVTVLQRALAAAELAGRHEVSNER